MYCDDIEALPLSGSMRNDFPAFCRQYFPLFPETSEVNYPGLLRWALSEHAICDGTDQVNVRYEFEGLEVFKPETKKVYGGKGTATIMPTN